MPGSTVNEYETLLMRHDLSDVLRDPLRFMAEKAGHILGNPRAIPAKTLDYAKYDLVRVFNRLLDASGLRESMLETLLSQAIAMPAARFLRMKRSVSLLVSDRQSPGAGAIVEGTYQSPILVQWHRGARARPHARRHAHPLRLIAGSAAEPRGSADWACVHRLVRYQFACSHRLGSVAMPRTPGRWRWCCPGDRRRSGRSRLTPSPPFCIGRSISCWI